MMSKKLVQKKRYTGTITLKTGLHIGDSKESLDIGGVDSPVVRNKVDNAPYIPGSSLKGKIRSLLELSTGSELGEDDQINKLFGFASKEQTIASKVIFRDAFLSSASKKSLKGLKHLDMPFTEIKFENTIDRFSGKAKNPRQIERVPAGTVFEVEIILNVFEGETGLEDLLKRGIKLLKLDYLGGSGSRGYGQLDISPLKCEPINLDTIQGVEVEVH